jgi:SAM-dependent methyltransferase
MNRALYNASLVEGAAGARFGRQHGGFYEDERILSLIVRPVYDYAAKKGSDSLTIADVGCGSGIVGCYLEKRLIEQGYKTKLKFIDFNKKMLEAIPKSPDHESICTDLVQSPISALENKVDIAVGRNFLHYNPVIQQEQIIKNIYSLLKKGGLFVNATGSFEQIDVVEFMSDYLNEILLFRNPVNPAARHYLTVQANLSTFKRVGFTGAHVTGEYSQRQMSSDYYERYGFIARDVSPEFVEEEICKILDNLKPTVKIRELLDIHKEGSGHSISFPARIFVAEK